MLSVVRERVARVGNREGEQVNWLRKLFRRPLLPIPVSDGPAKDCARRTPEAPGKVQTRPSNVIQLGRKQA